MAEEQKAPSVGPADPWVCVGCKKTLTVSCFSAAQFDLGAGQGTCRECLTAERILEEQLPDPPPALRDFKAILEHAKEEATPFLLDVPGAEGTQIFKAQLVRMMFNSNDKGKLSTDRLRRVARESQALQKGRTAYATPADEAALHLRDPAATLVKLDTGCLAVAIIQVDRIRMPTSPHFPGQATAEQMLATDVTIGGIVCHLKQHTNSTMRWTPGEFGKTRCRDVPACCVVAVSPSVALTRIVDERVPVHEYPIEDLGKLAEQLRELCSPYQEKLASAAPGTVLPYSAARAGGSGSAPRRRGGVVGIAAAARRRGGSARNRNNAS